MLILRMLSKVNEIVGVDNVPSSDESGLTLINKQAQ
jgi:hypothetical protein